MFKVGDWVYYDNGFEDVVFQIKEFDHNSMVKVNSYKTIQEKYLKLWQPEEGEWCWYPADYGAGLIRYDGKGNMELYEPFVGELPSFIKN